MKIVYIAHPISGNVESNLKEVRRIVRYLNLRYSQIVPFVPYYADIVSLDDSIAEERARGIQNNCVLLPLAHEVWLFGDWRQSKGCKAEATLALNMGKSVFECAFINSVIDFMPVFNVPG